MIGLDTNVLVRYLAQDDPIQSPRATAFIEQRLTSENPGFISLVTMVETAWVLERAYRLDRARVGATVERILAADAFVVGHEREVFAASTALAAGLGFADALIAALGASAGCSHTMTFDQKALRMPGFKSL
jgi:predicted nucleic-acid-binding protein